MIFKIYGRNFYLFILIFFIILNRLVFSALYYCIDALTDARTGQQSCVPPLKLYRSVNYCCTTDSSQVGNVPSIHFPDEPPETLPPGCRIPEIQRRGGFTEYHCPSNYPKGFDKWDNRMSLPLCCTQNIRQQYPNAVNIEVLLPGQTSRRQQGRQNIRPGGFQPGGGRWGICRDLAVPGRPSDCPANAHRCSDPIWLSVMAQQCLGTCINLCSQLRGTRVGNIPSMGVGRQPGRRPGLWQPRSRFGDRLLGGGRGCRDWNFPAGRRDCVYLAAMGLCETDITRMRAQCPARCNYC
ncbi:hypothetical protein ACQ4LE_004534 [Meloidogyne hapla]